MKKFVIFISIFLLCIIFLGIGVFLGVYVTYNNGDKFCEKFISENNDSTSDDNSSNNDVALYDKNGNVVMIKDFDKYFLSLDLDFGDNYEVITSSNSTFESDYVGVMYNTEISDEYKALYALNKIFANNEELDDLVVASIDEKNTKNESEINFTLSYETINSFIGNIFAEGEIGKDFKTTEDKKYEQILYIDCVDGLCEIGLQTGLEENGFNSTYLTSLVSESVNEENGYTEYVVSTYYIENTTDSNLYKLYDKKDGTLVKSIKEENFDNLSSYDSYISYFKKIPTYKYSFGEDGLLVEVEIVS